MKLANHAKREAAKDTPRRYGASNFRIAATERAKAYRKAASIVARITA